MSGENVQAIRKSQKSNENMEIVTDSPKMRKFGSFFRRRVWEAAPYEKNWDFSVYSVTLKRRELLAL